MHCAAPMTASGPEASSSIWPAEKSLSHESRWLRQTALHPPTPSGSSVMPVSVKRSRAMWQGGHVAGRDWLSGADQRVEPPPQSPTGEQWDKEWGTRGKNVGQSVWKLKVKVKEEERRTPAGLSLPKQSPVTLLFHLAALTKVWYGILLHQKDGKANWKANRCNTDWTVTLWNWQGTFYLK